jgi:hypothetical protein
MAGHFGNAKLVSAGKLWGALLKHVFSTRPPFSSQKFEKGGRTDLPDSKASRPGENEGLEKSKDVIIHSVEAWAIPGLMNWNNLEPLASETRLRLHIR